MVRIVCLLYSVYLVRSVYFFYAPFPRESASGGPVCVRRTGRCLPPPSVGLAKRVAGKGLSQVQVLEDRGASGKPLRETPPRLGHAPGRGYGRFVEALRPLWGPEV